MLKLTGFKSFVKHGNINYYSFILRQWHNFQPIDSILYSIYEIIDLSDIVMVTCKNIALQENDVFGGSCHVMYFTSLLSTRHRMGLSEAYLGF